MPFGQRILLSLLLVAAAMAQDHLGQIHGRVIDQTGYPLAGARIQVANTATNAIATAVATKDGDFLIPGLVPGNYRAVIESRGFLPWWRENIFIDNSRVTVDATLLLGDIIEAHPVGPRHRWLRIPWRR